MLTITLAFEVVLTRLLMDSTGTSWVAQPFITGGPILEDTLLNDTLEAFSHFICLRHGKKRLYTDFQGMGSACFLLNVNANM